ncbi:hypothetical protein BJ138DRAFT_1110946 [Hygrophoropsis aurantiaca]|uniref:Uncharacterized protein n=1 Tax=Hygrophoropsis aurantiaca TaxID=72124 RepID=A0ACB8AKN8_9AGAM|nr:hypothetical protein BJ138DRAFT_1110946 [Hygrophoropsis aurantiaca]
MFNNGRGSDAEVIANFHDGHSYNKAKLDEALRSVILDRKPPKVKDTTAVKREDIDFVVNEFEISRLKAEKALIDNGGDLAKTLRALVNS